SISENVTRIRRDHRRDARATLSPNLVGDGATKPNGPQTQKQMRRNIQRRERTVTFAPEIDGFVTEGREGRKPAEHPDENQCASFGCKDATRLSQVGKKADGQTTDEVYGQRAVGELN